MNKFLFFLSIFTIGIFANDVRSDDSRRLRETEKVFELPESVVYDPTNDVLYVSNITDHPFNKDGTGYISKLALDGSIIKQNGLILSMHQKV